uniref:Uncharacterized protein n=1 Tax=Mus musculus TaxID=10090 RepID=Q3UX22_MOUSE|nr:unnamed protein product [Mus musculus]
MSLMSWKSVTTDGLWELQEEPNSLVLFPETMSKGCDSPHSYFMPHFSHTSALTHLKHPSRPLAAMPYGSQSAITISTCRQPPNHQQEGLPATGSLGEAGSLRETQAHAFINMQFPAFCPEL